MHRSSWLLVSAFVLTACTQADDRGAKAPGADPTAAATPAAIVTVLYNPPKDPAAFEKYYAATHVPLVGASQQEIGFTRADLTKFNSTLDGKKPAFYRQAELYFTSMDDLQKGVATPGFKKVADDLKNLPAADSSGWSQRPPTSTRPGRANREPS
jgi:uncharacterized protein (TIGR02118 family)